MIFNCIIYFSQSKKISKINLLFRWYIFNFRDLQKKLFYYFSLTFRSTTKYFSKEFDYLIVICFKEPMIPIIQGIFQFYSIFVISVFSDLFICFEFTFMVGTIDNLFKYFDQPVSVVLSLLVFTYIFSYYKRLKIISFI